MEVDTEITPEAEEAEEISTLSTDQDDAPDTEQTDDADLADGEQDGEDGDGDDDGLVDVEWEGKTLRVSPEAKAALMRTADYTRKTQDLSEQRKALDAEREAVAQQAKTAKEIDGERVQYAMVVRQLEQLDKAIAEADADDADRLNELRWAKRDLRDKQIDLATTITQKQNELELDRQRSAQAAHAKAVQESQAVLQKDIKGWNTDLATKVGEFAVKSLGWTPQKVLAVTDPAMIKALHGAYVGDQAQRRLKQQNKLDAGDKTAPVSRPGGGASPSVRRTTDATGDRLSTAEWIRREQERTAQRRR